MNNLIPDWAEYVRQNLRLSAVRPEREAEIVEDLARQLDDAYREALSSGATEDDARAQAERHISNWDALSRELSATPREKMTRIEEWQQGSEDRTIARRGGFTMFTDLRQDVIYGLRTLRKSPGVTAIAVLSLALGIGANTAIFSVINALVLRTLPVRNPQELVVLSDPEAGGMDSGIDDGERSIFSYHEFEGFRDNTNVLTGVFAFSSATFSPPIRINDTDEGSPANITMASGAYFSSLGAEPLMGRTFGAEADQGRMANPVAVLSYAFWQRRMQKDPAVIGKQIRIYETVFDVIGVMRPDFTGIVIGDAPDMWIPITMFQAMRPGPDVLTQEFGTARRVMFLHVVGRLKPGVTLAAANVAANITYQQGLKLEATAIADPALRHDLLNSYVTARNARHGLSSMRGDYARPLGILMALVGLLLLLACANVANLLLAKIAGRQRELSVRVALGAGRGRLVRQLLTESVMLAMTGAALGILLAQWADGVLLRMVSHSATPVPLDVHPDAAVLLFAVGITLATCILFGLLPALRATRIDLNQVLRGASRSISGEGNGSSRLPIGKVLVGAQVAISLLLLVTAGLFIRNLQKLTSVQLGYDSNHFVMFSLDPTPSGYKPATIRPLFEQLLARLGAIPGVRAATLSENGIFYGSDSGDEVTFPGYTVKSGLDMGVRLDLIAPHFFSTIGIPVVAGRDAEERDSTGVPGAWLNQTMARYYFGDESPIGRHMIVHYSFGDAEYEVRGVVANSRNNSLRRETERRAYLPYFGALGKPTWGIFEVRYSGDASAITSEIRRVVRETDGTLDPLVFHTVSELIDQRLLSDRLTARLSSFFGSIALALACVGLYGVLSYNVTRRTGEIGVRMALGAQRGNVLALILREALIVTLLGAAVGLAAALAATRVMASMLYGVTPRDPVTMVVAAGVLLAVAALAAAIPAWRASRTDPITALRYE
ncbi:MAG TPA: ABC transporter permease [Candidatus Acidoferrales bacterium]|nr:ABC transporter permease [Candidatus Acidoferrales bacterium]